MEDIKQSVFDALSYEASKKRISLKRYIEEILEEASITQFVLPMLVETV